MYFDEFYLQVSPTVRFGPYTEEEANSLVEQLKGKAHEKDENGGYCAYPNARYPFVEKVRQPSLVLITPPVGEIE